MAFGSLDLFYGGLEAIIGAPQMVGGSLHEAMRVEHCERRDHALSFTSSNGVTTTSAIEWAFVVSPQPEVTYPERTHLRTASGEEVHPGLCRRVGALPT